MILKFRTAEGWMIYGELDSVEYKQVPDCIGKNTNIPVAIDVLDFTGGIDYPIANGDKRQVNFFSKYMNAQTCIIAYTPIYLMNDEGRTVETI